MLFRVLLNGQTAVETRVVPPKLFRVLLNRQTRVLVWAQRGQASAEKGRDWGRDWGRDRGHDRGHDRAVHLVVHGNATAILQTAVPWELFLLSRLTATPC